MAGSMKGLKRSHRCTKLSSAIGETVTCGWVHKSSTELVYYKLSLKKRILVEDFQKLKSKE